MKATRRGGETKVLRPVLLTEPKSQEPSGAKVPDNDEVITEPTPQEPENG